MTMNRTLLMGVAITLSLIGSGCTSTSTTQSTDSEPDKENVIATIGERVFTQADLARYYEKNNLEKNYTSGDLREFLPFYVNFQLKLMHGKQNGLYEDPEILDEYQTYAKQAAYSYWLENDIKQQLLEEYAERSKFELNASHILIRMEQTRPGGASSDEAVATLEQAREEFLSGDRSMEELNQTYSSQVQGRPAGGDLPWITAGVTVKSFEDALFSLEPGEISEPVRTQFGYHLIYLEEKRERTPDRKTRHIFVRPNQQEPPSDQVIQDAYKALDEGRPWNDVVEEFTQDGSSADSGGDIGWIGYGRQFSADFIETVLAADTSKSYTEPLQTNYGYHIFRIDSVRSYRNEDQRIAELEEELKELPRFKADRQQVLERLADVGAMQLNDETADRLAEIFHAADTAAVQTVSLKDHRFTEPLITFNGREYTTGNFKDWLDNSRADRKASRFSDSWIDMYREQVLDGSVIEMTRENFQGFDREIDGFLDGLVVFQVSDENIWNPESADTTALKTYFEEHRDQYRYEERFDYTLIASGSDSLLTTAIERVEDGDSALEFKDEMDGLLVIRDSVSAPSEEIRAALDELAPGELSTPFSYRNSQAVVQLHQLLPPRRMTFEEAINRVNSDYQPIREELFMSDLRKRYDVQTFPERIQSGRSK